MAEEFADSEQLIVDKFKEITSSTISSRYFNSILQCLKRDLYNKNYLEAFGNEEYLDAYLARYVPSRAIVYYRLMKEHKELLGLRNSMRITNIGGGAGSELSGLQHLAEEDGMEGLQLSLIDIGKWDKVVDKLKTQFKRGVDVEFVCKDVLADSSVNYEDVDMITILFTISELFIQSKSSTLQLLNKITEQSKPGTKLVIAESVGLSNIPVGAGGREYPLTMILDHALKANWTKTCSEDAKWFRLSESIKYPIKLENARCIVHRSMPNETCFNDGDSGCTGTFYINSPQDYTIQRQAIEAACTVIGGMFFDTECHNDTQPTCYYGNTTELIDALHMYSIANTSCTTEPSFAAHSIPFTHSHLLGSLILIVLYLLV